MANDKESIGSIFERLRKAQNRAAEEKPKVQPEAAEPAELTPADVSPAATEEVQNTAAEAVPSAEPDSGAENATLSDAVLDAILDAAVEVPAEARPVSMTEDPAFAEILNFVLQDDPEEDNAAVARRVQSLYEEYRQTGVLPLKEEIPSADAGAVPTEEETETSEVTAVIAAMTEMDATSIRAESAAEAAQSAANGTADEPDAPVAEDVPAADDALTAEILAEMTEMPAEAESASAETDVPVYAAEEPDATAEEAEETAKEPAVFTAEAAEAEENAEAPEIAEAAETAVAADTAEAVETAVAAETAEAVAFAESASVPAEEPVPAETAEVPEEEDVLMAALGYTRNGTGSGAKKPAPKKPAYAAARSADLKHAYGYDGRAYQSRAQRGEILRKFDEDQKYLMIRAIGTGVFTVLLLIFDLFGKKFTGAWNAANYPVVNLMISLQLLVLCAAFSARELGRGIRGIIEAHPVPSSVTAAVTVATLLYNLILALDLRITHGNTFTLYNSPAAFCLCIQVLGDYLKLNYEKTNFEKLSGMESLCVLQKEKGTAYSMRQTDFVNGFFRHTNLYNGEYQLLNFVLAPVVALSLIMFLIALAAGRHFNGALNTFIVCIQMAMPVFAVICMDIPFYLFQLHKKDGSAILLHENDTADYEKVEKIVLDETDMFRGGSIRITGLTPTLPDYDYFTDLAAVSAIGEKVGGTISQVFGTIPSKTGADGVPQEGAVTVEAVTEGGIVAAVEGREYLIGSRRFLNDNGIPCMPTEQTAENGSITFHISVDGTETLQIQLQYKAGPDFSEMLQELTENGNNVEIRCYDPNLSPEFVKSLLGDDSLRIQVIRVENAELYRAEGETEAGLIGEAGDWKSLMRMADACGNYRKVAAFNRKVMAGVAAVAALLALVVCAVGTAIGMSPVFILLIYVATLVPSVVISRLV